MNIADLGVEDQKIVNYDFGTEVEKQAQEKVAMVQEMYQQGHDKIASDIANEYDELIKAAAEEEEKEKEEYAKMEKKEEEKDEEEKKASISLEKTASELGAFIERGVFDGLQKLGSERHQDPLYYFAPYIEEKVAQAGAESALAKFAAKGGIVAKALGLGRSAKKGAKGVMGDYAEGARQTGAAMKGAVTGKGAKGGKLTGKQRAGMAGSAAADIAVPSALLAGGALAGRSSKN